ncbi:hypothetical protein ABT154_05080 [Streptomyces sp. NPDC001728]|uniref:hypothetical protein n=1 Tax=Streptomyces sp. NPDC001728 TaxID=3154396 RepID=UPI00332F921F
MAADIVGLQRADALALLGDLGAVVTLADLDDPGDVAVRQDLVPDEGAVLLTLRAGALHAGALHAGALRAGALRAGGLGARGRHARRLRIGRGDGHRAVGREGGSGGERRGGDRDAREEGDGGGGAKGGAHDDSWSSGRWMGESHAAFSRSDVCPVTSGRLQEEIH